jgi:glucose-6-phosphate 1-dehydrogenase
MARNELVIRVQPNEAVYMKFINKKPGLGMETTISELDLSYNTRYSDAYIPDAYEALILDVLKGNGSNFVRVDELECAWKIFTPVLHQIEREKIQPEKYPYGSRGPANSSEFVRKYGFVRHATEYVWSPTKSPTKL